MNTITSILVVLALGAQAQPLGSVAESQSLVRRTHPKRNRAHATQTFVPVPVFINGNGPSSNSGSAPPNYNNAPASNYVPVSSSYDNAPSSNYNPKPDYQSSQVAPDYSPRY
ncbi:hypothetical protein DSO57_1013305 [Entomophthora muscae]|uniref:Uncharacterized protein n=1 Tax=Entomophthora muscae TaxID=34485 RepID=A0ACC2TGH2_9FUNG|nr:hypothetical protein DSO57_1013305 [Entomophthora muscae]